MYMYLCVNDCIYIRINYDNNNNNNNNKSSQSQEGDMLREFVTDYRVLGKHGQKYVPSIHFITGVSRHRICILTFWLGLLYHRQGHRQGGGVLLG